MVPAPDSPATPADRPTRTRSWIVAAFNRLVLRRPYEAMGVAEVAGLAGVGRSTFYEHFRDKDDLLRHALEPVFAPLADAAVGNGDADRVRAVADHIEQNRSRTLAMLDGPARGMVERTLAEMILARLADAPAGIDAATQALVAAQLAGSQLGLLRAWLAGGPGACPSSRLASMLVDTTSNTAIAAQCVPAGAASKPDRDNGRLPPG